MPDLLGYGPRERLEYTMPYQNVVKSLSLPFIIVHMGDVWKNRRLKVNSISLLRKRKPSKRF